MFVCEVPLLSGLTRAIDLQISKPTAYLVASGQVLIRTNTKSITERRLSSAFGHWSIMAERN